jgi:hypothetical protein
VGFIPGTPLGGFGGGGAPKLGFVAVFQVVTTDAQVAIYNAKYKDVFWRPVTATRGSPDVTPDPTWTPLFTTPLHPEYPSLPGDYAGAARSVLTAFLGPQAPAPVSATGSTDPGSTDTYTDWAEITHEVMNAALTSAICSRRRTYQLVAIANPSRLGMTKGAVGGAPSYEYRDDEWVPIPGIGAVVTRVATSC